QHLFQSVRTAAFYNLSNLNHDNITHCALASSKPVLPKRSPATSAPPQVPSAPSVMPLSAIPVSLSLSPPVQGLDRNPKSPPLVPWSSCCANRIIPSMRSVNCSRNGSSP